MPPPTVTPHRVGKNATISVDGVAVRRAAASITVGGGTDTQTLPSGYDIRAGTNRNATGSFQLIVYFGETLSITSQTFHDLLIVDGTNTVFDGIIYVDSVAEDFANDAGWQYTVSWSSHEAFDANIVTPVV